MDDNKIRLFSFQPIEAVEIIENTGCFQCNIELSSFYEEEDNGLLPEFEVAYQFIIDKMNSLGIEKPDNVDYPIWAWYKQYDKNSKPDLRKMMNNEYDSSYVIIELLIDKDSVVLSDFSDYHFILNNGMVLTNEEWLAYEKKHENDYPDYEWLTFFTESEKKDSWHKIFNIEDIDFVQACFWEIKKEDIVKIHKINRTF